MPAPFPVRTKARQTGKVTWQYLAYWDQFERKGIVAVQG